MRAVLPTTRIQTERRTTGAAGRAGATGVYAELMDVAFGPTLAVYGVIIVAVIGVIWLVRRRR